MMLLYRKRCLHESQRKTLWLSFVNPRKDRSSRSQMFFKIGVVKHLRNFTEKYLCWESLFKKAASLMACKLYLIETPHRCFHVKFRKFLWTPFFTERLWWLLLEGVCEGTTISHINYWDKLNSWKNGNSGNSGMVYFAEINQAPEPYSMLQYIGRVATPKLVPRNCLRYLQTTLIMGGGGLASEFMWGIVA